MSYKYQNEDGNSLVQKLLTDKLLSLQLKKWFTWPGSHCSTPFLYYPYYRFFSFSKQLRSPVSSLVQDEARVSSGQNDSTRKG